MLTAFITGFLAGLGSSIHCLGMCGGFSLHLAKSSGRFSTIIRQIMFLMGKGFTYMFLGVIAAALGVVLLKDTSLAKSAIVLRLLTGVVILVFGLIMLGLRFPSLKVLHNASDTGLVKSVFGGLLHRPGYTTSLLLGLSVGFLPCPLPMAMLAICAASHNIFHGIILMAGVGLGTAPALLGVGLFGAGLFSEGLGKKAARIGLKTAGVVLVFMALLTIGNASGLIHKSNPVNQAVPTCCGGQH